MDGIHFAGRSDGFHFEVHFHPSVREAYRPAIRAAADRWAALITGPKPPAHTVAGRTARGTVMVVSVGTVDGKSKRFAATKDGWAPWTQSAGFLAGLPAVAEIVLDRKDVGSLATGLLEQVVAHEIGHALGVGVAWRTLVIKEAGEYVFKGPGAMKEYGQLLGGDPVPVPVDDGARYPHWRESTFSAELMSPKLSKGFQAISRMTLASLVDLGYEVKLDAADAFPPAGKP